ncbi:cupin domain-containing protein [uncultured Ruminococcus sp.]|uniref:cupin domain-containing protein n=1 Tax=uncultured Ruminococcus sp. TaxID=165186 RepID=UPI0033901B19
MYKNIEKRTKLELKDPVVYQEGQVVSKTLVQNDLVSMTFFSFDKREEISMYATGGDAMVTVLEGKGRFTVGCEASNLEQGETLIMSNDMVRNDLKCSWWSRSKNQTASRLNSGAAIWMLFFYYLRVCLLHNQACIQAIVHQNNKKMSPSIDILKNMGYNNP